MQSYSVGHKWEWMNVKWVHKNSNNHNNEIKKTTEKQKGQCSGRHEEIKFNSYIIFITFFLRAGLLFFPTNWCLSLVCIRLIIVCCEALKYAFYECERENVEHAILVARNVHKFGEKKNSITFFFSPRIFDMIHSFQYGRQSFSMCVCVCAHFLCSHSFVPHAIFICQYVSSLIIGLFIDHPYPS